MQYCIPSGNTLKWLSEAFFKKSAWWHVQPSRTLCRSCEDIRILFVLSRPCFPGAQANTTRAKRATLVGIIHLFTLSPFKRFILYFNFDGFANPAVRDCVALYFGCPILCVFLILLLQRFHRLCDHLEEHKKQKHNMRHSHLLHVIQGYPFSPHSIPEIYYWLPSRPRY